MFAKIISRGKIAPVEENTNMDMEQINYLTMSSNVIDALYVRKTFAVSPGMSSFR